ncbi:MAG: hypothetical protein QMC67_15495 [Candidatus Wallbacteria bacterium]
MSTNSQLNPITIPFRKIICKKCQFVGDSNAGFKIYDSEEKERVSAVCEHCGTSNLIKKERKM